MRAFLLAGFKTDFLLLFFQAALGLAHRHGFFLALLFHRLDVLIDVGEIHAGTHPFAGIFPQRRELRLNQIKAFVRDARDAIGFEAVRQARLAQFHEVIHGRQDHVGNDALFLRGAALDAVEFRDGELQLARIGNQRGVDELAQRHERLHGAFAVRGLVADHDRAPVILQRRRDNFRGRRAEMAHRHDERAVVNHLRIRVVEPLNAPALILHLHDRTLLEKQPGQIHGLAQHAAAVAPQIKHHALHVLLLQALQQHRAILGAMFVKLRQRHDAPAFRRARRVGALHHHGLGLLLGEFDFVADDFHDAPLGAIDGCGRDHGEPHLGVARAADHFDDLVELHIDGVHRLGLALRDGDDAVVGLDLLAHVGRAAGHDAADARVAVIELQHRADAAQRELHVVDVEIRRLDRTHVIGVRVVAVRERGEINLENFREVVLLHRLEQPRVTLGNKLQTLVGDGLQIGLVLVLGQAVGKQFEFHPRAPEGLGFGRIFRPREFVAGGGVFLVHLEIDFLLEDGLHEFVPLLQALDIHAEDVEGGRGISGAHELVQRRAVAAVEAVHVGLEENQVIVIQRVEVVLEQIAPDRFVERLLFVMRLFEQSRNGRRDAIGLAAGERHAAAGIRRQNQEAQNK